MRSTVIDAWIEMQKPLTAWAEGHARQQKAALLDAKEARARYRIRRAKWIIGIEVVAFAVFVAFVIYAAS